LELGKPKKDWNQDRLDEFLWDWSPMIVCNLSVARGEEYCPSFGRGFLLFLLFLT